MKMDRNTNKSSGGRIEKIGGLNREVTNQIVDAILKHKKAAKIVVFGSRAQKDFKDVSDIDIAIFGKDWTDRDINIVRYNLNEDMKTPLKFDVLNFYSIKKEKLKNNILREGKNIYES